jgi:Flp pilus assembly pilin Flp
MALNRILDASMRVVARTRDDETGQALVEYSLLILLLAVAAIAAVRTFGLGVSTLYQSIINVYP